MTEPNLSRAEQWLKVSYSVWFNRRHGRSGHLFQGRFKSVVVSPFEWGLALSRYLHLNPVRVRSQRLGKVQQQRIHAGASSIPEASLVQERVYAVATVSSEFVSSLHGAGEAARMAGL